jgi:hypothetical protein
MAFPMNIPLFGPARPFNSWTTNAMELTLDEPRLVTIETLDSWPVQAMELTIDPPLVVAVFMLYRRSIQAMELVIHTPLRATARQNENGTAKIKQGRNSYVLWVSIPQTKGCPNEL